jgi:TM2 domain-containing membrane protein YozV
MVPIEMGHPDGGLNIPDSVCVWITEEIDMATYAVPMSPEFVYMQGLTEQQQMMFMAQYSLVRKDVTAAILLAFFLGSFGAHRFYMGEIGMGFLYLIFCWSLIPHLIALIECFFLPERVRQYNAMHAAAIANQIRGYAV